jgi:carboxylate-amine ligase
MRITDVCTRVDDALTIAALYQSLLRFLVRLRRRNLRWRIYPRMLVQENRWLAQRHGVEGQLVDLGKGRRSNFSQLAAEILELVREDAEELDCIDEVENIRQIVEQGASAQRQRAVYRAARASGADEREALAAVVDFLIEETAAGLS